MPIAFNKLNTHRTKSMEIVSMVKDNLVNGELKPGDKLPTEMELIEQLGVSRTPVREAIKILEAIGVIEIKRGEGMFITQHSSHLTMNPLVFSLIMHSHNMEQLIEFRQHFEVLLMNMIITKEHKNLDKIEAVYHSQVDRMNPSLSSEELADIDLEFHYAVLEETENPFTIEIGRTIYELIRPKMIHFKHSNNIERTLATHKAYLNLLKEKEEFEPTKTVIKMIKNNEEMIR
ncbi:DNA-binding transcriptional regulator, FadR family [Thalassobacillus cyri]|uniref:DNA-binding transcriptional regulator, FadR family n=1 Tax=Thalassobacillus cyri TaxID=571932 RepID=A0A1H4E3D7_9BACI|nr:GntR family transcriptional regulator [Thalassobacillus cyri]SEA79337.1 DNA-binding transcriptional regulator, FadR family [Thalassobacillus cyri]